MNRAYLSRNDIEQIAKRVSEQYKSVAVPQKHLCYAVDPVELADVLGLQVDFQYLTKDGSVLGLASGAIPLSCDIWRMSGIPAPTSLGSGQSLRSAETTADLRTGRSGTSSLTTTRQS